MSLKTFFLAVLFASCNGMAAVSMTANVSALMTVLAKRAETPTPELKNKIQLLSQNLNLILLNNQDWKQHYPQLAECEVNAQDFILVTSQLTSQPQVRGHIEMMLTSMEMCLDAKINLF